MTRPDADRLFARFAQRGDPAALAQVFDLRRRTTAPGRSPCAAVEWGLTSVRIVPEGSDYEPSALVVLERRDVVEGELPIRLQRRGERSR